MKLLHGSNVDVIHPDLMECHDGNDFGKGFYLTDNPLRAVLMAKRKMLLRHKGGIFVSKFLFSLKDAEKSGLKILRFKNFTVEWARFILQNRCPDAAAHEYDIVIGPVADSTVDSIIEEYKAQYGASYLNDKNLTNLIDRISQFGLEYIQYCFCTEKSLSQLTRI